eukprot:CAMPEP_0114490102 /NCGR_PEP_ID=MMETSP0109-20121206/2253_1 /TAXON_ID=29199 /ORGANISM="Chlorarachnion reptans, Strain CCCM449" /LENGTH=251 /DNA_ID=CAMNT_0001666677 /DNA_START=535 /DNA_END=1290 /DNA_ORIENTATION=+
MPVMPSDFPLRAPQHISIPHRNPGKPCPIPNSPVKKDAFLPTDSASLDILDGVSSDSDNSTEAQRQFCPCCRRNVNFHGKSYHSHLVQCLTNSKTGPKRFSAHDDEKKITDIRSVISKLNLHLRIGIMESFYRLSRGVMSGESPSPRLLPTSGTNAEASDKQVLALLYGKRIGNVQRPRNMRKAMMKKQMVKLPRTLAPVAKNAVRSVSLTKPKMKSRHLKLDILKGSTGKYSRQKSSFMFDNTSLLASLA